MGRRRRSVICWEEGARYSETIQKDVQLVGISAFALSEIVCSLDFSAVLYVYRAYHSR